MVEGNDKPIIVVTGCGSSGTKYITKFFKRGGVHIGHEVIGPDGISSWYITSSFKGSHIQPPYKAVTFSKLKEHFGKLGHRPVILHQVRDPLKSISTFQRSGELSWIFVSSVLEIEQPLWREECKTKDDEMYRLWCCMYYWLRWNMMAESVAHLTYRIEDIGLNFERIIELIQRPELAEYKEHMLKESIFINSRKSKYVLRTWGELFALDKKLTEDIIELGQKYGYKIKGGIN